MQSEIQQMQKRLRYHKKQTRAELSAYLNGKSSLACALVALSNMENAIQQLEIAQVVHRTFKRASQRHAS